MERPSLSWGRGIRYHRQCQDEDLSGGRHSPDTTTPHLWALNSDRSADGALNSQRPADGVLNWYSGKPVFDYTNKLHEWVLWFSSLLKNTWKKSKQNITITNPNMHRIPGDPSISSGRRPWTRSPAASRGQDRRQPPWTNRRPPPVDKITGRHLGQIAGSHP
jgi:hypothetical protein